MNQKFQLLIFSLTLSLLLFFFWPREQIISEQQILAKESSPTLETFTQKKPILTPAEDLPAKEKPSEALERKIAFFPKNITQQYQESLETDPHQTPTKVLHTALELGKIYDLVSTEDDARTAFNFFDQCVIQEKVIAIQTACFRYARQLSQNHPSLDSSFQNLMTKTNQDVLRIVQMNEL